jgi:hypothetical protein
MRSAQLARSFIFAAAAVSGLCLGAEKNVPWIQGNHVVIQLLSAEQKDSARYELWVSGPGDIRVEEQSTETNGKKTSGSILLIGGRFLATKGIELHPGMEIDVMDIPALNWQLTAQLLEHVYPGGPAASLPINEIKKTETAKGLEVGTMSAGGEYGAPWTVAAKLSRDASGLVNYQLNFQFMDPETSKLSAPMKISGTWEHQMPKPEVPDSMSLAGWKILSIGPTSRKQGNSQILDYGASSSGIKAQSVGEVRRLAAEQK